MPHVVFLFLYENFWLALYLSHSIEIYIRHKLKWFIILSFIHYVALEMNKEKNECDKIGKVIAVYSFDILPILWFKIYITYFVGLQRKYINYVTPFDRALILKTHYGQ